MITFSTYGAAAVALSLMLGALSSCGGTGGASVAVRIGDHVISEATVVHWTGIVDSRGAFTGFRGRPSGDTPRQRALALLISSYWLVGEAAQQGVPVSELEVDEVLAERGESPAEIRKRLQSAGQTLADLRLELRAELALEAIREKLARRAADVTNAEITTFYRGNRGLLRTPAVHVVDIVEGLPSERAALSFVRRVGTGSRFTKLAYRKELAETPGVLTGPKDKKRLDYAIYAAKPGIVSRPMPLGGAWVVFVVRRVIASSPSETTDLRGEVVMHLTKQREQRLTRALERKYRTEWTSKTHCHSGYVVAGCARYRGTPSRYEDPFMAA